MKIIINEGQYKQLLNEIISGEIYHYSRPDSLYNILNTNSIKLSSNLGNDADMYGDKPFFLSLSRTKSLKLGYRGDKSSFMSRIVFDGDRLNSKFKSIPVNYFNRRYKHIDFEYEERIISDEPIIKNINKYIKRIDIVISNMDWYGSFIKWIKGIILKGEKLGILVYVYKNEKDLILGRNTINDEILNSDTEEIANDELIDKSLESDQWYEYIILQIFAIILFDWKYFNEESGYDLLCSDLEEFKIKNNVKTDVECSKLYQEMDKVRYDYEKQYMVLQSVLYDLFKYGGEVRKDVLLLTKEMKRNKVNNLKSLYDIKINGKK